MARAGNIYVDLARAFASAFPIEKLVSTKEFDLWGMDMQEISPLDCSYDHCSKTSAQWQRLLVERNDLRRKINAGAASDAFAEQPSYPAFSVDVHTHGEDYYVRSAIDSYEAMANRLPEQVFKFATTKRGRIARLKNSVDFPNLPAAQQLSVSQLDRHIRLLLKDIKRRIDDFNEEYAEVQDEIRRLNLRPSNGGLLGFTGTDEDQPGDDD